jgi:hypothetical protein
MLKSLAPVANLFFPAKPSAATLAKNELEDAQRALLAAHSSREYADAMVSYHQRRISRLQAAVPTLLTAANDPQLTHNQRAVTAA